MTEPLFREEAVEHVRRAAGGGDVVRVAPRWTEIAVFSLGALFVAALIASVLIHVDRLRLMPAVAQAGSREVRAAAPAEAGLHVGSRATFALTESGEKVRVRVVAVGKPAQGAVPVLARADEATDGGAGVLEVKVGDRPLIAQLVPGQSSQR